VHHKKNLYFILKITLKQFVIQIQAVNIGADSNSPQWKTITAGSRGNNQTRCSDHGQSSSPAVGIPIPIQEQQCGHVIVEIEQQGIHGQPPAQQHNGGAHEQKNHAQLSYNQVTFDLTYNDN
jgi:hypothetical protein